jgi:hypothetical protein
MAVPDLEAAAEAGTSSRLPRHPIEDRAGVIDAREAAFCIHLVWAGAVNGQGPTRCAQGAEHVRVPASPTTHARPVPHPCV